MFLVLLWVAWKVTAARPERRLAWYGFVEY